MKANTAADDVERLQVALYAGDAAWEPTPTPTLDMAFLNGALATLYRMPV